MSYQHLSIREREKILSFKAMGLSLCQIAKELGRNKSTISRFPKGYDFNTVLEENLQAIVDQLNRRPRKYLGYKTPAELYFF